MSVVKNPSKVYIGNIPRDAEEKQINTMFGEAGKLLSLEFKGDFAFAEYGDSNTAEEAIRKFDGVRIRGRRLIVEPFRYRGGDPRYRRPPPKNVVRGEFRIIVTNLSSNTTAQDLRDWVEKEKLNSVTVTDVYNRHGLNEGVVEYRNKDDWDFSIRNLDHVKLDGHYVRVYDEREYNRRKLKIYDRPPPPRRDHGGHGPPRRSRSYSPNNRRYGARDNNRYNDKNQRNGGGGADRQYSPPQKFDRDRRDNRDRERGGPRNQFRSNSRDRNNDRNRDRDRDRNDRDRDDRGGRGRNDRERDLDRRDRGGNNQDNKGGGYNRSRSRSRSRDRGDRNDRNDRYNNRQDRDRGDNRDRDRDRNDRYDRGGQRGNDRGGGYRERGSRDRYDRR